jgi:streptomycin 6-kinase
MTQTNLPAIARGALVRQMREGLLNAWSRRVIAVHGAAGEGWLERFPSLKRDLCTRWGIALGEPFELSYNFVVAARRGTVDAVLKLGVPNPELSSEIEALRAFEGRGAVRLLEADAELGALLIERVMPGVPLFRHDDDDRAMAVAASAAARLWCTPPREHAFRSVHSWTRSLRRLETSAKECPLPAELVERAQQTLANLEGLPPAVAPSAPLLLLHADFHQGNVLERADGTWKVIDPKGAVGDVNFDLAPLVRNFLLDCEDPAARLTRRIERLCRELSLPRDSLLGWSFVGAMLAAAWNVESGASPDAALRSARLMESALYGSAG